MNLLQRAWNALHLNLRARVVTGLAVIVPLFVTVWVVRFVFRSIDGILQPQLAELIGRRIPGAGLLATLILLYLAGVLVQNLGGKTLLFWAERVLLRLPFLRDVYGSSKQIVETFIRPDGTGFKRVVTFEYPRPGSRAFGFVTNEVRRGDGSREVAVFLPTTPNPTSGFLLFLPAEDVEETSLSVEEALKMIVSGGVVIPRPYREIVTDSAELPEGTPSGAAPARHLPAGAPEAPAGRGRDAAGVEADASAAANRQAPEDREAGDAESAEPKEDTGEEASGGPGGRVAG